MPATLAGDAESHAFRPLCGFDVCVVAALRPRTHPAHHESYENSFLIDGSLSCMPHTALIISRRLFLGLLAMSILWPILRASGASADTTCDDMDFVISDGKLARSLAPAIYECSERDEFRYLGAHTSLLHDQPAHLLQVGLW